MITHLSLENKTDYVTCSPFAPVPISEVAKLPRLEALELISCGVPLSSLARERALTLTSLTLIRCLVSTEDLASALNQLEKCEKLVVNECKLWSRSEGSAEGMKSALERHKGTLKELVWDDRLSEEVV